VRRLLEEFKASERHICALMAVPRSSSRYRSRRDDSQVQERLRELAHKHPRFGYRRLHLYPRKEMAVNHKKVQRVYRELGPEREAHAAQASAAHAPATARADGRVRTAVEGGYSPAKRSLPKKEKQKNVGYDFIHRTGRKMESRHPQLQARAERIAFLRFIRELPAMTQGLTDLI